MMHKLCAACKRIFSLPLRIAARLRSLKIAPHAPLEALALAAFFFAVISFPFLLPESGENGLGQPDLGIYEEYDEAPEGAEIAEAEDPEVPPKNVLSFTRYTVEKGDTISEIASKNGRSQDSIISCNNIERARLLQIGTELLIPNMNGIMHRLVAADTLEKLAVTYRIPEEQIREVNNIEEDGSPAGEKIFIPEAKLPSIELRRVWGELFRYPVRGWITSRYGYRNDPFTGKKRFHNGIDIAGVHGQAVGAALEGRVIETGFNNMSGNYVVVAHAGGYVSSYAHLSLIRAKKGDWLKDGQRLGDVGSTGYSTGDHLHFSISRWGKSVNPALLLH
ncbi:MAG: M23 family metallopeptidase [Spirochaetaceae bacterium]|nr:M23 family metallopeptidase [Spirochaetaceae bacterium]